MKNSDSGRSGECPKFRKWGADLGLQLQTPPLFISWKSGMRGTLWERPLLDRGEFLSLHGHLEV